MCLIQCRVVARAMATQIRTDDGDPKSFTLWGITTLVVKERFASTHLNRMEKLLDEMISCGYANRPIPQEQNFIALTETGVNFARERMEPSAS